MPNGTNVSQASAAAGTQRITLPKGISHIISSDFRGSIYLERFFHRPTGLNASTTVQLATETSHRGSVQINSSRYELSMAGRSQHHIKDVLEPRNRLCVQLVIDETSWMDQPMCEAWLAIDSQNLP